MSTPQELVERALELSKADGCVVLADEGSSANLRWARNTLTTNGVVRSRSVTVIAVVGEGTGAASGVVSRTAVTPDELEPLVRAAEQAARDNSPAEDAAPLVEGDAAADWDAPPEQTSIGVFSEVAPALGEAFGRGRAAGRTLYGYVEHAVDTTYLGSSTGLRARHAQPAGYIVMTARSGAAGGTSAWVGQATRDFADVDVGGLDTELERRLSWSRRRIELPPGRYDTVLPPTAVADLLVYAYWEMGARDAADGRTVYSRPGVGTRVGEQLVDQRVTVRSDPYAPGLQCAPFAVAHASSGTQSVFDNGLPLAPTAWIQDGTLTALHQSRYSARLTGLSTTPEIGNLMMEVAGAVGGVDDLARQLDRGLLLTCLWYIREVEPQTLLLTGLTRDGVYLVEDGEVVGSVNNFRFNESPVDLLGRFSGATATVPTLTREWTEDFPRTAMPALRIPDFNMSTVSHAF